MSGFVSNGSATYADRNSIPRFAAEVAPFLSPTVQVSRTKRNTIQFTTRGTAFAVVAANPHTLVCGIHSPTTTKTFEVVDGPFRPLSGTCAQILSAPCFHADSPLSSRFRRIRADVGGPMDQSGECVGSRECPPEDRRLQRLPGCGPDQ